jgi:hypothetical protein
MLVITAVDLRIALSAPRLSHRQRPDVANSPARTDEQVAPAYAPASAIAEPPTRTTVSRRADPDGTSTIGTSRPRGSIAGHGLESTLSPRGATDPPGRAWVAQNTTARLGQTWPRFGDPGSPNDVASELSVDARNTVDLGGVACAVQPTQAAQMDHLGARTIKINATIFWPIADEP